MELTLGFEVVNWWAVLSATVAVFLLGGLWYSPVMFGRPGIISSEAQSRGGPPRRMELIFIVAFLLQWCAASMLAAILGPNATAGRGLQVGLLVGVFFATTAIGITYIFEKRPMSHFFINAGYIILSFGIMGSIIGWRN